MPPGVFKARPIASFRLWASASVRPSPRRLPSNRSTAIYSSPLRRAREGAACVADQLELPVREDDRLMEIHAGVFQGLDWADIQVRYPREATAWRTQDPDFRIPGGESRRDLMSRMGAVLREIRETPSPPGDHRGPWRLAQRRAEGAAGDPAQRILSASATVRSARSCGTTTSS